MKKKIFIVISFLFSTFIVIYFFFPGVIYNIFASSMLSKAGMTKKSVVIENHEIYYIEGGNGIPVVMLHGFGLNKGTWFRFSKFITPNFRTIVPDIPGFGESSKVESESYSIESQVSRIDKFVKSLKLDKFHLIGHSMGGAIAGKYTVDYPDKVLSLALFAPYGVTSSERGEFLKLVDKSEKYYLVNNIEEYKKLQEFMFENPPPIPGVMRKYLASLYIKDKNFIGKIGKIFFKNDSGYNLDKYMNGINVKTLIIWDDKDRIVHVSGADVLANGIKGSQKVIIKNCGHLFMMEKPEETAGHYLKFLRNI